MHEDLSRRADVMRLSEPAQLKALGHPLRGRIVTLLLDRTASVSMLAEALGTPVGTVGHHVGVLEDAGLLRVASTRQVRGIVEKRYARTARLFLLDHHAPDGAAFVLSQLDEARAEVHVDAEAGLFPHGSVTYARVSPDRAQAFYDRLVELLDAFRDEPADGDVTWGMVAGVFPTTRRPLRDDGQPDAAEEPTDPARGGHHG